MTIVAAYLISLVGGWLIAGGCVWLMRRSIKSERVFFKWLDIWVGFTERAIVTTLFIWTPGLVPSFIGGWMILKIAAGWQRAEGLKFKAPHLVALVGSSISFSVAIAAGILVAPESIGMLASTR